MGRPKKGWSIETDPRSGKRRVRFTHEGRQHNISTGETVPSEAEKVAADIYADVVSGRYRKGQAAVGSRPGEVVDQIGAEWCADEISRLDPLTIKQYLLYVNRWQGFFRSLDRIHPANVDAYSRARLKQVKRKTLLKELSALRTFLDWAKLQSRIAEVPVFKSPSKRTTGTPTARPHKSRPVVFDPDEIEAVIGELPELSPSRGRYAKGVFFVKAFFEVAWETGLRPGTLSALRAPDDYRKGGETLTIRDEADKARFGRELPLTEKARAALDRVCPEVGLIFGEHTYKTMLRKAAVDAQLAPEKAEKISPYDFRHSRLTWLGEHTDSLVGLQFLAGHKQASTTAIYMHAHSKAAAKVLAASVGFSPILVPDKKNRNSKPVDE